MRLQTSAHKFIENITVEPASFLYFLAYVLLDVIDTNLYLQKACRFNTTQEPNLDIPCDDEKQGVLFVSSLNGNYRFIEMTSMIALVTLLMCWSDDAGKKRKILIILPILGIIAQSINGILQSYFWYWSPLPAALTDMALHAVSGGFLLMLFGTQLYVCDISSVQDRTMRVGILIAVITVCAPISNGMSGFLIRSLGFFNSFALCLILATASLASAVLLVKDISVPTEKKVTIFSVFKCTRIVDSFRVVFKRSLGRKRAVILLLFVVHAVVLFSTEGEKTVFYLFMRIKFHWDERMYSVYQTYKLAGMIVGTIFCSVILSKICKIHDGIIGTFAGFWDVLAALGYIFASETWHLYLIPLLDIFHGTAIAICFSFLTKFYESSEFGRLNAVYNTFSLLIPFCHPTYNIVFQKTVDYFPSAFFCVSVVINIVVCSLYGSAYILTRKFEQDGTENEEPSRKLSKSNRVAAIETGNGNASPADQPSNDVKSSDQPSNDLRF